MLQVMKIPSLDNSSEYESVLWDSACSGLFVRDEHARKMGFVCQQKRLRVITLGGDVKEIDGVLYQFVSCTWSRSGHWVSGNKS